MEKQILELKDQVMSLSAGTIGWCIRDMGIKNIPVTYDMVDDFRNKFIDFIDTKGWSYPTWQDAYYAYKDSLNQ